MKDYYKILEVHPEASDEVIHKAYRTLAQKYHPDRYYTSNKSYASERMKDLNEAYTTLSNETQRARYNRRYQDYQTAAANESPPVIDPVRLRQAVKNFAFWAMFTVVLLGFGRLFFITPVGRILLVILAAFLFFRFFRRRAVA